MITTWWVFMIPFQNGWTDLPGAGRCAGGGVVRSGFTIIEMIIVILLLGVLASMALPRFGNMVPSAANANASAIAGALGAAAANYNAKCSAGLGVCDPLSCDAATLGTLVTGITPSDYLVGGAPVTGCTISHIKGDKIFTSASIL